MIYVYYEKPISDTHLKQKKTKTKKLVQIGKHYKFFYGYFYIISLKFFFMFSYNHFLIHNFLRVHIHYAARHTAAQHGKATQQKSCHATSICERRISSAAACHSMLLGLKIWSTNCQSHQRKLRDIDATTACLHSFWWYWKLLIVYE